MEFFLAFRSKSLIKHDHINPLKQFFFNTFFKSDFRIIVITIKGELCLKKANLNLVSKIAVAINNM